VRAPPPPRHARVSAPAWPPRGTERAWTYNASLQRVFGLVAAKVRRTRVTTLSTGCKNVTGSGTGRDARLTLYGACSHSVLHICHGSWRAPRLEGNTTERAARPPPFSALSPRCEARWRGRPPVAATAAAAAPLQTPQQRWRRQQRDVASSSSGGGGGKGKRRLSRAVDRGPCCGCAPSCARGGRANASGGRCGGRRALLQSCHALSATVPSAEVCTTRCQEVSGRWLGVSRRCPGGEQEASGRWLGVSRR